MCRSEADRTIRPLEEFGPAYFEVSQLTRISPVVFRAIAPAVSGGVLHHNGEAIPLNEENSRKVAAAVADMRKALPQKSAEPCEPDVQRRIQDLAGRCAAILTELDRLARGQHTGITRICLRNELNRLRDQILRVAA